MSNTKLDKYLNLKKRVESAQQQADQAEGALGEIMGQIKEEFGCTSLKLAKIKLKQLEKARDISKKEFDDAVEKFEEDWSEELEEGEE